MTHWRNMIANESEPGPPPPMDADAWFTPGRFAFLLALFIALTFPGIILGQETFFYRDFGLFGYPLANFQRECFWRGELPLWNPLNDCGLPFMAQWNTLTFYPPALFYLVFPLSWSLGVFNLGHLFLAGMGMYFLARQWMGNRLAASVAGIAFAFNGLTWHSLMWPNDIAGLGWMPWVVLTAERAWREGGRCIVFAALAGALQMLTGAPEIILLTWLFIGVLWAAQFGSGRLSRIGITTRIAAVGLLVAGLAAVQLLPFLDLLRHSHRDTGFATGTEWAMPLSGPANFLVPRYHTYRASQGVFVQYDQYWISSHYLGVGVLALAIAGAWGARKRRVWLLAVVAVLSVAMALGNHGHLYTFVRAVLPQLGFIRYPIKFVVVAMLVLPLLAGYGVRWFQEAAANSAMEKRTIRSIVLILTTLIAVIIFLEWKFPNQNDDWPATWRNAAVRAVFLCLAMGLFLSLKRRREFKSKLLLRIGFLLVLWVDVYTHAPNLSPTVSRAVYEPGLIRRQTSMQLRAQPVGGEPRFMETLAAMDKIHYTSLDKPAEDYLCRRLALFDNCNLLDDVPKIDGFYSLYLRDTEQVIAMLYAFDGRNLDLKGLKDFLGIARISASGVSQSNALDWMSRDSYLPLITAGQTPYFAAPSNTLSALANPNFDARASVMLPLEAKPFITANRTIAKVVSQQIHAQRWQFTVAAEAPALVVISQSFYYPWHAYVDDVPATLWMANHAFQAVQVPAGQHKVRLVYEDRMLEMGATISLASLAILGLIYFRKRNP